jgi:hypothetical protein
VAHASATRVMSVSSAGLGHSLLSCIAIGANYRRAGAPSLAPYLRVCWGGDVNRHGGGRYEVRLMARQDCACTMLRRSEVGFHLKSATLRQSHRENPRVSATDTRTSLVGYSR